MRVHPKDKRPPLTEAEMRAMYRDGDSVSTIANRAKIHNGLSKAEVRVILFGGEA